MLAEFTIGRDDAGQRAERYLRRRFAAMALDRLQSLFRRREIKIARKPIERSRVLLEGEVVQVYGLKAGDLAGVTGARLSGAGAEALAGPAGSTAGVGTSGQGAEAGGFPVPTAAAAGPATARPRRLSIPILHEDSDILVLDKPAGRAVHPGTGVAPGESIIEDARAYLEFPGRGDSLFRPSLVHRLDKDTSGVLVIAKTGESLRHLTAAMRRGEFRKRYLALVEGLPSPARGTVEGLLRRVDSRAGGAKAEVSQDGGKWAVTRYETLKVRGNFSLLGVIIETGRMHQIRAHLAGLGHPLAGDSRYGSYERARALRKELGLKRIFLHAADLEFPAADGRRLAFHAPLPADLSAALDRADAAAGASSAGETGPEAA